MSEHPPDSDLAALADGALAVSRANEVRRHLEYCSPCLSVVAQLARVATGGGDLPASMATRVLAAGERLGRYEILGRLGSGAMGVVYSAHDPVLSRPVAIKVLRELAAPESRERLLHEARILARLNHPHVSAVYDAGHDAGVTYLAMELLTGTSLRVHLLAKSLDWASIIDLFRQAAEGLAAAHAVGIVQRDFKPDNVMVTDTGRAVVTDFGLAMASAGVISTIEALPFDSELLRTTRGGQLIGTPAYMSPEQLRGLGADALSDQFSFCVALHEALTGSLPFAGNTVRALSTAIAAGQRVAFKPRVPASSAEARAAVLRVLDRGLSAEPQARFASMTDLVTELEGPATGSKRSRVVAGAVFALGVSAAAFGALAWQRHQTQCTGAAQHLATTWNPARKQAIAAAFSKSGLPFAPASLVQVTQALDRWSTQWAATRTAACEETTLRGAQPEAVYTAQLACLEQRRLETKALVDVLSEADDTVITRSVGAVSGLTPLSLCQDANVLLAPVPPPATPEMALGIERLAPELAKAKALGSAGQFAQSLEAVERVSERVNEVGYKPLSAWRSAVLGAAKRDTGDADGASEAFFACTREATEGRDDARAAECHIGLLFTKGLMQGRAADGHAAARTAEALMTRLAEDWHLASVLLSNEGSLYTQEGQPERALPLAQRAVSMLTKQLGPEHNEVARAEVNLGAVDVALHRYQEAERMYLHALGVFERVLGPGHPSVAVVLNNMVEVLASQKRYPEARAAAERALHIREKVLGPAHRQTVTTRLNLAGVQALDGQLEPAKASLEAVIAQWDKDLGPTHVFLGDPLNDLGSVLRQLGRPAEALRPLERALALREGGQEGPYKLATTQVELAQTLVALRQDFGRAKKLADAAHAAFKRGGEGFEAEAESARQPAESIHLHGR